MRSDIAPLEDVLRHGPAVLLLGQRYLAQETGNDPLLRQVLAKYASSNSVATSYRALLSTRIPDTDGALAWIAERARALPPPRWLATVAQPRWNAVYSSSIENSWYSSFRDNQRTIQPIHDETYVPVDPRNRTTLHATHLYGTVDRLEPSERAPLLLSQYRSRHQRAIALLRRLPDLVTPIGALIIDGYAGDDFLPLGDLLAAASEIQSPNVHFFGVDAALAADPEFADAASAGLLVAHTETLASWLQTQYDTGALINATTAEGESEHAVYVGRELISVPRSVWVQTVRSGRPLTARNLTAAPPLSADGMYREFRRFLASAHHGPSWEAYSRGFAFERDFEKTLLPMVVYHLESADRRDEPLILHGPTGTGKTIALQRLCVNVGLQRNYPVVYIEKRLQRPKVDDIDTFCHWADLHGARAALVVWDGMLRPADYRQLLRQFTGRGRNVVLVGSSYELDEKQSRSVIAPASLTIHEKGALRRFLSEREPAIARILPTDLDERFLVTLYRILPPTRATLTAGITAELGHAEDELLARVRAMPSTQVAPLLAQALLKAGVITSADILGSATVHGADEVYTDVQLLTAIIMVPGQLGLNVPLELVLRVIGREGFASVAKAMQEVRVFEWYEDSVGNIELGPRSELEAQVVVRARLGGPKMEVDVLGRLLDSLRNTEEDYGSESNFAVELLRRIDTKGPLRAYYAPYYVQVADRLADLWASRGMRNPRLMLQEAKLRREWVRSQGEEGAATEMLEQLHKAERTCDNALQLTTARHLRDLRAHLLLEKASTLGTRTQLCIGRSLETEGLSESVDQVLETLREVRIAEPGSYYSIDVLSWVTREVIGSKQIDEAHKLEAIAELKHAFLTANEDAFPESQRDLLQTRKMEMYDRLGEVELSDAAFAELDRRGSSAGYYLKALAMSGLGHSRSNPLPDRAMLSRASHYLNEHAARTFTDARCLDLLLELTYVQTTGFRPFDRERRCLGLSPDAWLSLLGLCTTIANAGGSPRPADVRFLRAISLFHLGRHSESFDEFEALSLESGASGGRRRVVRHYRAATNGGEPKVYHGVVRSIDEKAGKGAVHVEELGRTIPFFAKDFRITVRPRDLLPDFCIAFNYLGPLADPERG